MLVEKVKNYFEKYPELKILFLFDSKKEYLEEISKLIPLYCLIDFIEQSNLSTLFEGSFFIRFGQDVLRNKLPKLLANQIKLLLSN